MRQAIAAPAAAKAFVTRGCPGWSARWISPAIRSSCSSFAFASASARMRSAYRRWYRIAETQPRKSAQKRSVNKRKIAIPWAEKNCPCASVLSKSKPARIDPTIAASAKLPVSTTISERPSGRVARRIRGSTQRRFTRIMMEMM